MGEKLTEGPEAATEAISERKQRGEWRSAIDTLLRTTSTREQVVFLDFNNDNEDPTTGPRIILTPQPGGGFAISIGFGLAENIDFRNRYRSDSVGIGANFWEFAFALEIFPENVGLPATPRGLSRAIINQSSNTASHELGHILGLRHHDSFGPPGSGLPTTGIPAPQQFVPVFPGLQAADETLLHTMATGASVGLSFTGGTIDNRFSQSARPSNFNSPGRWVRFVRIRALEQRPICFVCFLWRFQTP